MTLHKEGNACACARGEDGCPFMNEQFIDAKLTECGKDQATVAGDTLSQTPIPPQCVFVSPLFRTLETCSIALSKCAHLKDIPVIADEGIRERNGVHHCDMRSPKEEVAHLFPIVDFKNIKPGKDELFSEVRETEEEVAERGNNFFLSLQHREESTFAVFSHSSFLYNTLSRAFDTPDSQGKLFATSYSVLCINASN